jgi:hypothetical protein
MRLWPALLLPRTGLRPLVNAERDQGGRDCPGIVTWKIVEKTTASFRQVARPPEPVAHTRILIVHALTHWMSWIASSLSALFVQCLGHSRPETLLQWLRQRVIAERTVAFNSTPLRINDIFRKVQTFHSKIGAGGGRIRKISHYHNTKTD